MSRKAVCSKHAEAYLIDSGCKWCEPAPVVAIKNEDTRDLENTVTVWQSYTAKPNQEVRVDLAQTAQPSVIVTLPDGAPIGSIVGVRIHGSALKKKAIILTSMDAFIGGDCRITVDLDRDNEMVALERHAETWEIVFHAG
jgi:hypothetical protein